MCENDSEKSEKQKQFQIKIFPLLVSAMGVFRIPVFAQTHLPEPWTSKTGFGQVKIMKELVRIICFLLHLPFGQVGEKK
jgi:hypothetical protein